MLKYGSRDRAHTYIDSMSSRGFLLRILKPTRFTHPSATLIDHILTNDMANHFAVFHISATNSKHPKLHVKHYRSFSSDNIANFRSELSQIDFSEILSLDCPNDAFTKFIDLYINNLYLVFPLRGVL